MNEGNIKRIFLFCWHPDVKNTKCDPTGIDYKKKNKTCDWQMIIH